MVDPFTPSAFNLQTLTAAINNVKYAPGRLGALGLFNEQGISTLSASIEERDGVLELVDIVPRGGPGEVVGGESRKIHSFTIPHMPARATVMADEVQGVRLFGSENQAEVLQTRVNERLATMRRNLDYTLESHRVAALMGNYYDANGATQSLFTTFGVSQASQNMALSASATSKAREKATIILEKIEDALDGVPFSGVHVFCSSGFWKALLEDKDAKETYLNTQMAASLRNDPRLMFDWNGITWERYRGTSSVAITANKAYAVPMGVPNLFITRFAPANYNETVNTIGLPVYAKGEPMKFGKGWELEAQSNALNICTRPASVIELTVA
jgi:hypothetical protein